MYTILCIKYKTDKDLQYSTRNYTQYFAISSKGKESEKNRDVCVCVCVCVQLLNCVQFFINPWTAALQAPLSMDFPGKNIRSGCHFHLQGTFPTQGLNPHLLHWQTDSLLWSQPGKPRDTYGLLLYLLQIDLNHFAVRLKLTQHCKSTILQ